MKIGINLAAAVLKKNVQQEINGSGCPLVVTCYVLQEILADAQTLLKNAIEQETEAAYKEQKGSENNEAADTADHEN